jgi:ABC-type branched-subunit amino acid transport system ATPase component
MAGEIAAMTLVGGMRSFAGPAVGAAVFVFMRDTLSSWTQNWLIYFGVIFIAFVMFSPNGIVGVWGRLRGRARRAALAPALAPAGPPPAAAAATPGGAADGEILLEVHGLSKRFGALAAVDGVSFRVRRGELSSIIGPNGAGKTTLFNLLTGLLPAEGGEARFRGAAITPLLPHQVVARGVSRSFQIISVFHALTVFENVRIAAQAKHRCRFAMLADSGSFAGLNEEARRLVAAVGLADQASAVAANLSHGDQRLLEIAIALALRPQLLLLDEPTAGMSVKESWEIVQRLREIRQRDRLTIVIVEHDMEIVMELAERITVLHLGRVLAEGAPEDIARNPEVQRVYLGGR